MDPCSICHTICRSKWIPINPKCPMDRSRITNIYVYNDNKLEKTICVNNVLEKYILTKIEEFQHCYNKNQLYKDEYLQKLLNCNTFLTIKQLEISRTDKFHKNIFSRQKMEIVSKSLRKYICKETLAFNKQLCFVDKCYNECYNTFNDLNVTLAEIRKLTEMSSENLQDMEEDLDKLWDDLENVSDDLYDICEDWTNIRSNFKNIIKTYHKYHCYSKIKFLKNNNHLLNNIEYPKEITKLIEMSLKQIKKVEN